MARSRSKFPPAVILRVKTVPGASRTEIAGWLGDELKIRIASPAEKGKANRELESFLGELLELPAGAVRILRGHGSARKAIEIAGLSQVEVLARLEANGGARG